jgi:hypothetical protein
MPTLSSSVIREVTPDLVETLGVVVKHWPEVDRFYGLTTEPRR